jgi:hypothetical protein
MLHKFPQTRRQMVPPGKNEEQNKCTREWDQKLFAEYKHGVDSP